MTGGDQIQKTKGTKMMKKNIEIEKNGKEISVRGGREDTSIVPCNILQLLIYRSRLGEAGQYVWKVQRGAGSTISKS